MTTKRWFLPVLGVVAYLVFAVAKLPASVILDRLPGLRASGADGTVWNGQAAMLQIGNTPLGSVKWHLHALPLLAIRLSGDAKVVRPDGFIETGFSLRPGGKTIFTHLSAALPVAALGPSVFAGGWTGSLNARMTELSLQNGWPVDGRGNVEVRNLVGPARSPNQVGSYQATFPAEGPSDPNAMRGSLVDLDGPLQVAGTLKIAHDHTYLIEGSIAARPNAPADVARTLQFLGEPDASGRRPFSLSGSM